MNDESPISPSPLQHTQVRAPDRPVRGTCCSPDISRPFCARPPCDRAIFPTGCTKTDTFFRPGGIYWYGVPADRTAGACLFLTDGGIAMEERKQSVPAQEGQGQERPDLDDLIFRDQHWTVSER